jgi:hypothetical protein
VIAPPSQGRTGRYVAESASRGLRAACGGADMAKFVVLQYSPVLSGRSRLLRAAWRPCSRGPARPLQVRSQLVVSADRDA